MPYPLYFSDSNVGIGQPNPAKTLDITGDLNVTGILTVAGSAVAGVTIGAFGSTPNANGLSIASGVLTLQPADATRPGALTVDAQTVTGAKKFTTKIDATGTQSTGGIGGDFAPAFGIHFPASDNTIHYRTGSVGGGSHQFGDVSGTTMTRISSDGLHLEAAPLALWLQYTDSTGTPGSATINKSSGRSAIASGQTTCVVTNNLCTATSLVMIAPEDGLNTTVWYTVVPTAGSFTVTVKVDPGATWKFRWILCKGE